MIDRLIAGVALVAAIGSTGWALVERAGRMEAREANATLAAEVAVVGAKLDDQTARVQDAARVGREALQQGAALLRHAEAAGRLLTDAVKLSETAANAPAPPNSDCREALREIRGWP